MWVTTWWGTYTDATRLHRCLIHTDAFITLLVAITKTLKTWMPGGLGLLGFTTRVLLPDGRRDYFSLSLATDCFCLPQDLVWLLRIEVCKRDWVCKGSGYAARLQL